MTENFLNQRLSDSKERRVFRKLSAENSLVDFASNDYLGFARSEALFKNIEAETAINECKLGATGSRLLTGNTNYCEALEEFIAHYHQSEAGLIFNSGYDANIGLIASVAKKEDAIIYDALSHASIYDGIRLSKADSFPFNHNDLSHLEERLIHFKNNYKGKSNCFVIVESVYSMDGDFSPLTEMVALCNAYKANLIVDEAHATGIFGKNGEGRVVELNLQNDVFSRVHTFGKALGCHGAIVLGGRELRDYLINFSRSFIYTTALPFHALASIKCAYEFLSQSRDRLLKIRILIGLFKTKIVNENIYCFLDSSSPIQSMIIEGNDHVKKFAALVGKDGFDVRPILSPTVQKGKERIRICLHSFNTEKDIIGLIASLKKNSKLALQIQLAS